MADSPHTTGGGTGVGPGSPPRAPRWVKVSAIVVGALILLVVIAKLTGLGGDHGPGRHMGADGTPPTVITEIRAASGGNPGAYALEGGNR